MIPMRKTLGLGSFLSIVGLMTFYVIFEGSF